MQTETIPSERQDIDEKTRVPLPPNPVTLTPEAARMVQAAMSEEETKGRALRVGVYGGGCSGLQYLLDFAQEPVADDFVSEQHGVTVYVDPYSAAHLTGTTLRYVEGPDQERSGFKFDNPNMVRGCGCGMAS